MSNKLMMLGSDREVEVGSLLLDDDKNNVTADKKNCFVIFSK